MVLFWYVGSAMGVVVTHTVTGENNECRISHTLTAPFTKQGMNDLHVHVHHVELPESKFAPSGSQTQ